MTTQTINQEFRKLAISAGFVPNMTTSRIQLDSCTNGQYHPDGVLLLSMDSLDIWSFPDEATATDWLKDEILCCEASKLMQRLPEVVQVSAIKLMPNQVWNSNTAWWSRFMRIVASCYSTEIGCKLWVEVNQMMIQLESTKPIKTTATNLSDLREKNYNLSPVEAVKAAFIEDNPDTDLPDITQGKITVTCGDWCAFID